VKVLLSAYACEPGKGSEQEVGLRVLLAAARRHDVWVLTRENSISLLEDFLVDHPLRGRIRLHGIDLDGPVRRVKRAGLPGLHVYYDAWQRLAAGVAAELDRRIDFDLVHHATFATYWTRAGVSQLGKPFVWGPVGGAVLPPGMLLSELGGAGLREEAVREAVRRVAVLRPGVRTAARAATVCLAQNASTARRLGRPDVSVLPNALTVRLPPLPPPEPCGRDVAFVGRLVPWKAGRLAVRALRHLRHRDSVLRIFGDGPDRARIERAARRWGLQDRVDLVGAVPRDELLARLRRCAVLLHPALHEEAGLSVAEALSLGVPVVALDHGGPADVVKWWPADRSALVRPAGPERTARRLAAAVDAFLDRRPPATSAPPPAALFESGVLAAYDEAVEWTRSWPRAYS
jgi:glycosyltransferase involved in cell wall biosynthesis